MTVYSVLCKLVGHDPACGIIDEDVESVCLLLDDVCGLDHLGPVAQVALKPDNLLGCCLTHFLLDGINSTIDDILGDGENEDFGNVVGKQGM